MKPVLLLEALCEALLSSRQDCTGQEYPKYPKNPKYSSCSQPASQTQLLPNPAHFSIFPHLNFSECPEQKSLLRALQGDTADGTGGRMQPRDSVTSPRFRAWKRGGKEAGIHCNILKCSGPCEHSALLQAVPSADFFGGLF